MKGPKDTSNLPSELFTIEPSHGKARLTQPRLSDLGTVGTAGVRNRDHDRSGRFVHGNSASAGRGAKRALLAPYKAAAERLAKLAPDATPESTDLLLADVVSVYERAKSELSSGSIIVESMLVNHAVETVLTAYFHQQAATVGLSTSEGARLLAIAQSCETHASRAMTGALAAHKALGTKRAKEEGNAIIDAINAIGESVPEGGERRYSPPETGRHNAFRNGEDEE